MLGKSYHFPWDSHWRIPRDQQRRRNGAQRRFGGTLGELGRGHEEQRSDVGRDLEVFFVSKTRKKTNQGKRCRWNETGYGWNKPFFPTFGEREMMWFFWSKKQYGENVFGGYKSVFFNWYLLYTKYMSNCILIYYFIQGSVFWRMQVYIESMIRYGDPWVSLSSSHRYRFKENATKIEHQFV